MRQLVTVSMQELDRMKCIEALAEESLDNRFRQRTVWARAQCEKFPRCVRCCGGWKRDDDAVGLRTTAKAVVHAPERKVGASRQPYPRGMFRARSGA